MQGFKISILILILYLPLLCHGQDKDKEGSGLAAYHFSRAEQLYEASRYDSVAIHYSLALDYYQTRGLREMELRCLFGLAEISRIVNDFSRCVTFLKQAESMLSRNPELVAKYSGELLFIKGKLEHNRGEYLKAVDILEEAVRLMDSTGTEIRLQARAVNFLGNACYMSGDLDRAEQYYRQFMVIISSMPGSRPLIEEAWYHTNMAIICSARGDYNSSIEHNKLSYLIQKDVYGDKYPDLGETCSNIAADFITVGSYDSAAAYLDTAEFYYTTYFPDDYVQMSRFYILRGVVEYKLGNHLNARHLLQRSWNLLSGRVEPSHYLMTSLYMGLGNIYYVLKDYERALSYY